MSVHNGKSYNRTIFGKYSKHFRTTDHDDGDIKAYISTYIDLGGYRLIPLALCVPCTYDICCGDPLSPSLCAPIAQEGKKGTREMAGLNMNIHYTAIPPTPLPPYKTKNPPHTVYRVLF